MRLPALYLPDNFAVPKNHKQSVIMKKARFQPLSQVYKELSVILYNTVLILYTTDFTQPEAIETIQKTTDILSLFENQMATEEAILFRAVHDYEPFMVAILRDDYRERMQYLHQLQKVLIPGDEAGKKYKSVLFSSRLLYYFNEFMTCCINQMKNHEAMLQPVLWRYYSDKELKQIAVSIKTTGQLFDHHTNQFTIHTVKQEMAFAEN